ncbi:MAG: hypothetical protein L3J18_09720 [Candidatus Brocadia sp.]|uniref:Uncharacterized protein n=1 Tax=Candidatus Brocadia fulgida TaxID=380242 RepID=A0A0M2UVP3_9BACT|nr:MAG: hypothetical protein BROFUL_01670 [Candidatus Brocadia fulgida]OQZ01771.1 MAG: hypothetical protein B6D35_02305 [Candidatus Brocadia sp. UTAMX2]UJS19201.1 MAG: hypothetical protein L3J18_09720 [Candidatus Brocadia sp.]
MKIRWIPYIVIAISLSVSGVVHGENERCQPEVVVFFGNGVWNDVEDADESRELLVNRLNAHVSGTSLEGTITYGLAYNPSEGYLADLIETFEQALQTNYSQFWNYLADWDTMPDFLQNRIIAIAKEVDAAVVSANPSVQEHIALYNQHLQDGKMVVLVAHSQGNLYGNIAYRGINQQYIDGFGIVSVANPDSSVAAGGPYTTIDEDLIIGSIPSALSPNLDNFFGPLNWGDIWGGHNFIKSYMAPGHKAEAKILNDVVTTINKLVRTDAVEIVHTYNILGVICGNPGTTFITIPQDAYVTEILTYHWCDRGQPAGTHVLYNHNSLQRYGPFSGTTVIRSWVSYPNTIIPAGSYEVIDSEPETWSHTNSGGFVIIRGIPCY